MGESKPPPTRNKPKSKNPAGKVTGPDVQNKAKVEDFSERGMGVAGKE